MFPQAEASADLARQLDSASASIQRLQGLIFPASNTMCNRPPSTAMRYYPGTPPSTSSSTSSSDDACERLTLSPPHSFHFSPRYEAKIPRTAASPIPLLQRVEPSSETGSARVSISRLVDDRREGGSSPPAHFAYTASWPTRPEHLRSESVMSPPHSATRPTFFEIANRPPRETMPMLRGPGISGTSASTQEQR
jgi:hypothetical protein